MKRLSYVILLIILCLVSSCTKHRHKNRERNYPYTGSGYSQDVYVSEEQNLDLSPGKVLKVEFTTSWSKEVFDLYCNDKKLPFYMKDGVFKAYIAESYFSNKVDYECWMHRKDREDKRKVSNITIKEFNYPKERLNVDKKRVFLSKKNQRRANRERKMLNEVYNLSSPIPLFIEPFEAPLSSYITSHYGTRRIYNNKKKSQHLGVDFRAKIGLPIGISNKGRVVFAGDLFYTGKTVIVDHGLRIFTVYAHLSKIKTTVGSQVKKGEIVGLSGMTGRVSGPHLHWGTKVNGHWVDGFSLVRAGL